MREANSRLVVAVHEPLAKWKGGECFQIESTTRPESRLKREDGKNKICTKLKIAGKTKIVCSRKETETYARSTCSPIKATVDSFKQLWNVGN